MGRAVPHYDKVNQAEIEVQFIGDQKHRAFLRLPFVGRQTGKTLCVIGQNPSAAGQEIADRTVRYLEEFVYLKCPEYSDILILNLYSRIDTTKSETQHLLHYYCANILDAKLSEHDDFLLIYGKLSNKGAYKFLDRARQVSEALEGKNIFKLGLDTHYPPHPGNPRILYRNLSIELLSYDLDKIIR